MSDLLSSHLIPCPCFALFECFRYDPCILNCTAATDILLLALHLHTLQAKKHQTCFEGTASAQKATHTGKTSCPTAREESETLVRTVLSLKNQLRCSWLLCSKVSIRIQGIGNIIDISHDLTEGPEAAHSWPRPAPARAEHRGSFKRVCVLKMTHGTPLSQTHESQH